MIWGIILTIVKLFSVVFLGISGFLLVIDSKEKGKKTLFYWGFGLLIWALVTFYDVFIYSNVLQEYTFLFLLRRLLLALSFVIFFLHGTLLLWLPEKQARPLIIVLFGFVIYLDIYFNQKISNIYLNQAMHNVYLINPLCMVFFAYFFTYYFKLNDSQIIKISLAWALMFALNIFFIFTVSARMSNLYDFVLMLIYLCMIWISFAFYSIKNTSEEVFHALTTPSNYVIDQNIEDFLSIYIGSKANDAIVDALRTVGGTRVSALSDELKGEFVDHISSRSFPDLSEQRIQIIKTKLISLVGMRNVAGYWKTGYTQF